MQQTQQEENNRQNLTEMQNSMNKLAQEKYNQNWTEVFWYEFNNEDRKKFKIGRSHFGSIAAVGLASYNLYNLKQKIIKQSIQFTRSKTPWIVKTGCFYIGSLYYLGLIAVWHIPSLSVQMAFNMFFSTFASTLNILNPPLESQEALLDDQQIINKTIKEIKKL